MICCLWFSLLVFIVIVAVNWCVRRKPLFPPILVNRLPRIKSSHVRKLETLGKSVFFTLNSNNLPYVVVCGSLLGIVRHHGSIIPWDDDIDIAIPDSHQNQVLASLKRSHVVKKGEFAYKVYHEDAFVDVFVMHLKDTKYVYENGNEKWPNEWLEADVFTTGQTKTTFYDSRVNIPKNPSHYLTGPISGGMKWPVWNRFTTVEFCIKF